jgi:hypothetical protein
VSAEESARPRRRPPENVALVARTHALVGAVILVSVALLTAFTRNLPYFEFGTRSYVIAFSVAAFYLLGGALVWFGAPLGRVVSRVCGLLYLARPFGSILWQIMDSEEFKAHFNPDSKPD